MSEIFYELDFIYKIKDIIKKKIDNKEILNIFKPKFTSQKNKFLNRNIIINDSDRKIKDLNSILNKITKNNFKKMSDNFMQIIILNKDNINFNIIIENIFSKAILQNNFCNLYVKLCNKLNTNFSNKIQIILLNICEKYKNIINKENKFNVKNYNDFCKYIKEKRKLVGIFNFIAYLYLDNLVNYLIIDKYINLLIKDIKRIINLLENNPNEEIINKNKDLLEKYSECLCKLLVTLQKNKKTNNDYDFKEEVLKEILNFKNNKIFSNRIRFKFMDVIDLFL